MLRQKNIFETFKRLTGILWDFPSPDTPLKYHTWKPWEAILAWLGITSLFLSALWAMAW
jgi:hypothetical protein